MTRPGVSKWYRDSDVPCELTLRNAKTNAVMDASGLVQVRWKDPDNIVTSLGWVTMTRVSKGEYIGWYPTGTSAKNGEYSAEYSTVNASNGADRKMLSRDVFEVDDLPAVAA